MIGELLDDLRENTPLVHCITNYVTANDCANILLALGASPVMADGAEDIEYITPKCGALCINLGTLRREALTVMQKAGKIANALGKPVVLDPAGAGASLFRLESALSLTEQIKFSAIRANASEVRALVRMQCSAHGVDTAFEEEESLAERVSLARLLAEKSGANVILSGETDVVTDGKNIFSVRGGNPVMKKITGAGCMLSSLTAAFAANGGGMNSCLAAAAVMKVCGKKAGNNMPLGGGTMTFKNMLIDEIYNLSGEELERSAEYEFRSFETVRAGGLSDEGK